MRIHILLVNIKEKLKKKNLLLPGFEPLFFKCVFTYYLLILRNTNKNIKKVKKKICFY